LEPRTNRKLASPPPGARVAKVIVCTHEGQTTPRGPAEGRVAADGTLTAGDEGLGAIFSEQGGYTHPDI
jgi:hypothetical protein